VIAVSIITAGTADRAANVARLCEALPAAVIIADDGTGIARRKRRSGCWPIARRAWAREVAASHHLVLEDDAGLCDGFAEQLAWLVTEAPLACVSLFHGTWDCSVATLMPVAAIARWLAWADADEYGSRFLPHHDHVITHGMHSIGVAHLRSEPSLVEHLPLASLLDHPANRAVRFEQSPASVALCNRSRW
jgi:hypothetical protein